jgi:hypothetical protein
MVRLFMLLIFVALVSIGVIQFGWFSRSATAEIRNVYRSTSSVVLQAAAREFQRYGSMIGDAGRSYASESGQSTPDSVEGYLANLYDTYGPEGDIPHLLLKVGYAENKAGALILENGSGPSDPWAAKPDFSIPELPLPINEIYAVPSTKGVKIYFSIGFQLILIIHMNNYICSALICKDDVVLLTIICYEPIQNA